MSWGMVPSRSAAQITAELLCCSVVLLCGEDCSAWYINFDYLIRLCRLLQRPATVPGGRGTAGEARSANEMRVLGMNQPFPAIFGGDDVRSQLPQALCSVNVPQLLCLLPPSL